jgi:hypothetical protein
MSGALPWTGSYRPGSRGAQGGGGEEADGAGQHGGFVRQDVAEQVVGQQHVELAGAPDQLHGGVVGQHVLKLDVRVVAAVEVGDHLAPEQAGLHDVALLAR